MELKDKQEAQKNRFVKRWLVKWVRKYDEGTTKYNTYLGDMSVLDSFLNAEEENHDQNSYVVNGIERVHAVIDLVERLDDSPLRTQILEILRGPSSAQSAQQPLEDSQQPQSDAPQTPPQDGSNIS